MERHLCWLMRACAQAFVSSWTTITLIIDVFMGSVSGRLDPTLHLLIKFNGACRDWRDGTTPGFRLWRIN